MKSRIHAEPVLSVDSIEAGGLRQVLSVGADNKINFWGVDGDGDCHAVGVDENGMNDVCVRAADGRIFATAGWDRKVRVWSTKDKANAKTNRTKKRELAILDYHRGSVRCLDFSSVTKILASGGEDAVVVLCDVYT